MVWRIGSGAASNLHAPLLPCSLPPPTEHHIKEDSEATTLADLDTTTRSQSQPKSEPQCYAAGGIDELKPINSSDIYRVFRDQSIGVIKTKKYKSPPKSPRETSPESSSSELITLKLAYPAAHWPKQTCRTKRTARRLQLILPTSVPVGGAATLRTAQNAYPLA
ncbi:hypothetical protein NDU88_005619 [Pleurodeles waltl]|uniref:Uncharacterized protein n=1 Tax=Pleurodeles waltl TaxID=8319 RepID=A0AAV7PG83_PLEWA|nr:hypothetical protein NDU88_005619 [Pleurodeles waltl]